MAELFKMSFFLNTDLYYDEKQTCLFVKWKELKLCIMYAWILLLPIFYMHKIINQLPKSV
ncbi:hypothetical protein [Plasmodium yoelii yoelii]|uniref:Uncharacterized protein n=1 Tax=Plasmodium yoelii yoelii TaxID=73239 RepID=Q7RB07_PLAYO|nr:hypothetical protein [Plasmodium yoelii yoelii]